MITVLALFVSTFIVVFALGAQSLLVNNGKYAYAFCNSFAISACNMVLYKLAPSAAPMEIAAFMLGGPFGIVAAMYVLRHLHRKPAPKTEPTSYFSQETIDKLREAQQSCRDFQDLLKRMDREANGLRIKP